MKKLTVNDIPEGYNYAAICLNGSAFAFEDRPKTLNFGWVSNKKQQFLGIGFDASDWENSLLEKKVLKKLTISDIGKGYSYAAVDSDGFAHAYKKRPIFTGGLQWLSSADDIDLPQLIGGGYDSTDWENSLIGGDPHVIEILNNKKKRKMEGATLESCKFEFTQDANYISDCSKIEKIKITHQSDLGLDRTKGGFFVLKTKGWSISSEDDIEKLLDRIRLAMKKE
jgi:hypothetical protein